MKCNDILREYVATRYDLDLWSLDLELLWSFGRHLFKLCVKCEQNRTIRCRVIDDLAHAHYRREIFVGVAFTRKDLRGVWTELHQTWWGHTTIISAHPICLWLSSELKVDCVPGWITVWLSLGPESCKVEPSLGCVGLDVGGAGLGSGGRM